MAILVVQNGYVSEIAGLGKIIAIRQLSEKRITKAVRAKLRSEYGEPNISVRCSAYFIDGTWHGKCEIYNKEYDYEIKE